MEDILKEIKIIRKELQDIHSILELKETKIKIGDDVIINTLNEEMKKQGKPLILV